MHGTGSLQAPGPIIQNVRSEPKIGNPYIDGGGVQNKVGQDDYAVRHVPVRV